jgi:hypothetical protein
MRGGDERGGNFRRKLIGSSMLDKGNMMWDKRK